MQFGLAKVGQHAPHLKVEVLRQIQDVALTLLDEWCKSTRWKQLWIDAAELRKATRAEKAALNELFRHDRETMESAIERWIDTIQQQNGAIQARVAKLRQRIETLQQQAGGPAQTELHTAGAELLEMMRQGDRTAPECEHRFADTDAQSWCEVLAMPLDESRLSEAGRQALKRAAVAHAKATRLSQKLAMDCHELTTLQTAERFLLPVRYDYATWNVGGKWELKRAVYVVSPSCRVPECSPIETPQPDDGQIRWWTEQMARVRTDIRRLNLVSHGIIPWETGTHWVDEANRDNWSRLPVRVQRRQKRLQRSDTELKLIAGLTQHHGYDEGECRDEEPISVKDLAAMTRVSKATVSRFFKQHFGGYKRYRRLSQQDLESVLRKLNGDFTSWVHFDEQVYEAKDEADGSLPGDAYDDYE